MHASLLMITLFLASQVSDGAGDRYGDLGSQPTAQGPTEAAPESALGTGPENAALGSEPEEAASAGSNFFDQIDAEAEPLKPESDAPTSQSSPSTETNPFNPSFNSGRTAPQVTAPPRNTPVTPGETDPAKLLSVLMAAPMEHQLNGTPLTLVAAVENSLTRSQQSQRIEAYWELTQAVANYHLAYKEQSEITTLRQGISLPHVDWTSALQAAEARLQLSLDRIHVDQSYLGELMVNTAADFAPLPSDSPYCGPYETRYAQIFKTRSSALAEHLNEFLPRDYEDLKTRSAEIEQARKWMFAASDARSPQSDGQELLKAYELYAARRRAFLSAVKEYNFAILRYTEIASPGTLDTERLVAMLIRTGSSPESTLDSEVQRANVEEAADLNDSSTAAPPTLDRGWNSTRQGNAERSILVPKS